MPGRRWRTDSPPAHHGGPNNLVAEFDLGYGDVDAAFAGAPHVFRDAFSVHRGGSHSIECRGVVANHDANDDRLTVYSSTQTPHVCMRMLADLLGRDENQIRVVTPDVGGGFGPKLVFYQEEAVVALAALLLRQPVKWIEDRREHFIATTQERDQFWDVEIAVDAAGKIRGFRGQLIHEHGAYTARGVNVPYGSAAALPLGYEVPAYRLGIRLALTNKVPVTPVRGAGQPQGVFAMERMLDRVARELGHRPRRTAPPQSRRRRQDAVPHRAQDPRRHAGRARLRRLPGLPAHGGGGRRLGGFRGAAAGRRGGRAAISASASPIMSRAPGAGRSSR